MDESLRSGEPWRVAIREKIDSSAAFVVVMSPAADTSEWVDNEVSRAREKGVPILPLLLEGTAIFGLNHLQKYDVTDGSMPGYSFLEDLRRMTEPPTRGTEQGTSDRPYVSRAAESDGTLTTLMASPGITGGPIVRYFAAGVRNAIMKVQWAPSGKYLLALGIDATAHVWDPETGVYRHRLSHKKGISESAWSPDGQLIATASLDRTVGVWNTSTGTLVRSLRHKEWATAAAWSPDSKTLASGGSDNKLILWPMVDGTEPRLLDQGSSISSITWSPNGQRIALAYGNRGIVSILDAATGSQIHRIQQRLPPLAVKWSPKGRLVATASTFLNGGPIAIHDAVTGALIQTPNRASSPRFPMAWAPDGARLAAQGRDRTVEVWDTETGEFGFKLYGHGGTITAIEWSPNGRLLATTDSRGTVRLWNAGSGIYVKTLLSPTGAIRSAAWSPNSRFLAVGAAKATVAVFQIDK